MKVRFVDHPLLLCFTFWGVIFFFLACGNDENPKRLEGEIFGSSYEVRTPRNLGRARKDSIRGLLARINKTASLLPAQSLIKKFNNSDRGVSLKGKRGAHLKGLCKWAKRVHRKSKGAFDPTVGPLVNLWGNDAERLRAPGSDIEQKVDSLKKFVGYEQVNFRSDSTDDEAILSKSGPQIRLDLSGIIEGYAIDQVGELLLEKKDSFQLVRIGNKYLFHGHPLAGEKWKIPIGYPSKSLHNERTSWLYVNRDTAAIATSGNFKKFYTKEGNKYSYTIDPETGYPTENRLLSVTVIAKKAAFADGMATAYMVMGMNAAEKDAQEREGVDAFFIGTSESGKVITRGTKGVKFSRGVHPTP